MVAQKYPTFCAVCSSKFPENPSEKVATLYTGLLEALNDPGRPRYPNGQPKGVNFLQLELCVAIQADLDFQNSYSVAEEHNWPAPGIDFQCVYERILELDKDGSIWGLLANDIVLRNSIAWRAFTAQIMDLRYKKIVDEKVVELPYTLQQFLAMSTVKKFGLINCSFAG